MLSAYYLYNRPTAPDPTNARVHEYEVARRTVYLTKRELRLVANGLVPVALFFWLMGLVVAFALARH